MVCKVDIQHSYITDCAVVSGYLFRNFQIESDFHLIAHVLSSSHMVASGLDCCKLTYDSLVCPFSIITSILLC